MLFFSWLRKRKGERMYLRPDEIIERFAQKPSNQLGKVQGDLKRLSTYITHLSQLSDEEINTLDITKSLDSLHLALQQFEQSCLSNHQKTDPDYSLVYSEDSPTKVRSTNKPNWNKIRKDTRQANKLVGQLTSTISRINSDVVDVSNDIPVPQDIVLKNQELVSAIYNLSSDWN
jgi:hypothetical protein